MICDIYKFLKEENEFTKTFKYCSCDLSHLNNISQRTADATGVHRSTVSKILNEGSKKLKKNSNNKEGKRSFDEKSEEDDGGGEGCSYKT